MNCNNCPNIELITQTAIGSICKCNISHSYQVIIGNCMLYFKSKQFQLFAHYIQHLSPKDYHLLQDGRKVIQPAQNTSLIILSDSEIQLVQSMVETVIEYSDYQKELKKLFFNFN